MGRLMYLLAGGLLQVAPLLSWQNFDVLGLQVPIPGLFWHGAWLWGLGVLLMGLGFTRLKASGLVPLAAGLALFLTWTDVKAIVARGDYAMAQLQLKLSPVNQMLANLNVQEIEIYHRGVDPWTRVGTGPYVAAAAAFLALAGFLFELAGERRRGRKLSYALLGIPSCRQCGARSPAWMNFCASCGCNFAGRTVCTTCRLPVESKFRFCPHCGASTNCKDAGGVPPGA